MERSELKRLVKEVIVGLTVKEVPIGISNRHIHLSENDFQQLFPNQQLQKLKALKQTGEFAAVQTVSLIGPKGRLEKVRILGPLRRQTQVEISQTDNRLTGLKAPIKMSGDLKGAADVIIKSEFGEINRQACIVAKRHIHMSEAEAERFNVVANESVSVRMTTAERTTVYEDVIIRVGPKFVLEMHIDTDEANAAQVTSETVGQLIKKEG